MRKVQCNAEFVFQLIIYGRAEGNVENIDLVCSKTDVYLIYTELQFLSPRLQGVS
jgi:hypothetical protein